MKIGKFIAIILGVLVLEGGILAGMSVMSSESRVYGGTDRREEGSKEQTGTQKTQPEDSEQREQEVQKIYKKNKKDLVLVNREHGLSEDYDVSLRTICSGRLQASDRLYASLVDMLAAASEEGHHYWIASAWRSREKQQKLVDEDVQAAMRRGMSYKRALRETYKETMPAGHSEHETGLALDILCAGNTTMDQSQKSEPANIWLRKNSWRYGFILRYPEDKESITGISYEPWHFRYVGKKAAVYMHKHDLTLEEFWEKIAP